MKKLYVILFGFDDCNDTDWYYVAYVESRKQAMKAFRADPPVKAEMDKFPHKVGLASELKPDIDTRYFRDLAYKGTWTRLCPAV